MELIPETPVETAGLDALWIHMGNRAEHVRKGEPIPVCCGKVMEIPDWFNVPGSGAGRSPGLHQINLSKPLTPPLQYAIILLALKKSTDVAG